MSELVGVVVFYNGCLRKVSKVEGDKATLVRVDDNGKTKRGRPLVVSVDVVESLGGLTGVSPE